MARQLSAISLFTGCGGLDYGFEAAGFRTSVAVECDLRCVETLRASRDWKVIDRKIEQIPTDELLKKSELEVGEADVLIGGPPCQPFSKAGFWASGQSKRLADPRASTLDHFLRVVEEAQPKAFLLENVEGLGFKGKSEGVEHIKAAIEGINKRQKLAYRATIGVVNAADYGVPQQRRRLFLVASREGVAFDFPDPTHSKDGSGPKTEPWLTAWDAISHLHTNETSDLDLRGKWADLLPSIPEGHNYLWHTDRGGGLPLFGWRRRYWSFLLKLAKNQPAWTIAAQPGPATGPFHWDNRRLSPEEMAKLQTFPDDVEIVGSISDIQRQIGNAVPSLLAEVFANAMKEQFFGLKGAKPSLVPSRVHFEDISPEQVQDVPAIYQELVGDHKAHPGTGLGFSAIQRSK